MRLELASAHPDRDGRALKLVKSLAPRRPDTIRAAVIDVYIVEGVGEIAPELLEDVFLDPVAQRIFADKAALTAVLPDFDFVIEVRYKAGVTDPEALTAREALTLAVGHELPPGAVIQAARQYAIAASPSERSGSDSMNEPVVGGPCAVSAAAPVDDTAVEGGAMYAAGALIRADRVAAALHNGLIQQAVVITREEWADGRRFPSLYPHEVAASPAAVETIRLQGLSDVELAELSRRRLLALSVEEMKALRGYYERPEIRERRAGLGLPGDAATDVELEMTAQTWSEHCKHKIFSALIDYSEEGGSGELVDSLFATYIRGITEGLASGRGDLRSVFHDNSGVVAFDDEHLVCMKVETHNSPSALDPYGGAITGIVGVNRDILGTGLGARPIFNTNVLCFGRPDAAPAEIPAGLLHPREVLSGVHHGIVDGGNQSGIPTAAGAFLFDESFTGKPLVFCGTAGILPARIAGRDSWKKYHRPGDLAVVAGGRVGKDGIHGATFSSAALDESSPTSAVQIGDPITQKKLLDFMIEARDAGLYSAVTDNGAGGISSSLGEMAQATGGVRIELDQCLFKYPGLAPWEILVSESQERMSFAVPPDKLRAFLDLARRRGVEASAVGEFTDTGYADIFYMGRAVGSLSLDFLHSGLPRLRLKARWKAPRRGDAAAIRVQGTCPSHGERLLVLLAEPNIASKEYLIRQYDHEVQSGSVVKPFAGIEADAPTDGGVFRPLYRSRRGLTITHGICPRLSDIDTYSMAVAAVDEAYRSHIALGGSPDLAWALDNFCWPDPVLSEETPDGEYKLAQLVRACRGLRDACLAYNLPLISGKDSMKNDARAGGKKISVRPTLLVTVMGVIEDIGKALTSDFKRPGDLLYLVGRRAGGLGGSLYEQRFGSVSDSGSGGAPFFDPVAARSAYEALAAVVAAGLVRGLHDISDGGLAVALAESALGGRLGCRVDLDNADRGELGDEELLYGEAPGRLVASVDPGSAAAFEAHFTGQSLARIGSVEADGRSPALDIRRGGRVLLRLGLDEIERAWKCFSRALEGRGE